MLEDVAVVKPRVVVKRRRPKRLGTLLLSRSVIGPVEEHLQMTGQDRCEEAALLAGYVVGRSVGVVTTALLPYTDHGGGGCALPLDVTARCFDFVKRKGQILLAQIHTHPGRGCGHSLTDDDWAICDSEGFFSIIVPCFGRFGLARVFEGDAEVHERMADGEWRRLGLREIRRRFHIIPENRSVV